MSLPHAPLAVLVLTATAAPLRSDVPEKAPTFPIALVDMARTFNEYRKFEALNEDLKRQQLPARQQPQKLGEIFRSTYLEVVDVIQNYSRKHGIRIVLRTTSSAPPDPRAELKDVQTWVGRQMVYSDGIDITDEILRQLNEKYDGAGRQDAK